MGRSVLSWIRALPVSAALVSAVIVQPLAAGPDDSTAARLDQIQFKATHNSYRLDDPPEILIDHFNVWELEFDFGMVTNSGEFWVGHDEPENHFGLQTLGDWILRTLRSEGVMYRPLIIKLEAKTDGSCQPERFGGFVCVERWPDDWQEQLRDSLSAWLADRWLTRREFEERYNGSWPTISDIAGRVIITIQDDSDNTKLDTSLAEFFVSDLPGLSGAWPPLTTPTEYGRALQAGLNRMTVDHGYREPWSNVGVHMPLPMSIDSSHDGWQWGTITQPYSDFCTAGCAAFSLSGLPLGAPELLVGACRDSDIPCAITLIFMDVANAGTRDAVYVALADALGAWQTESRLRNPVDNFTRAGVETFWLRGDLPVEPTQIPIRVDGDDDLAVKEVIVVTPAGRFATEVNGWIGPEHTNPTIVDLTR